MMAPIANETVAAGPACPAASPGKTKMPAPTMVPIPMASACGSPNVRSNSLCCAIRVGRYPKEQRRGFGIEGTERSPEYVAAFQDVEEASG